MSGYSPVFKTYEEFWIYCFSKCEAFKVGCAKSCEIRKRLAIPPFENSYLGKLEGKIIVKA